jgi:hypothetical protein
MAFSGKEFVIGFNCHMYEMNNEYVLVKDDMYTRKRSQGDSKTDACWRE